MWHPKLRGYMYQIVEIFPVEEGNAFRELHTYDRLEDAEKVMAVLESVNYNFTCYGMIMVPVWKDEMAYKQERQATCDHNGSTTTTTTRGDMTFYCPKCGLKRDMKFSGWDANGKPTADEGSSF